MLEICLTKLQGRTISEKILTLDYNLDAVKRRYGPELANILRQLLATDPEQRQSFREIPK